MSKPVVKDPFLCDLRGNVSGEYKSIYSVLNVSKPKKPKKELRFHQFRNVNTEHLSFGLNKSLICLKSDSITCRSRGKLYFNRAGCFWCTPLLNGHGHDFFSSDSNVYNVFCKKRFISRQNLSVICLFISELQSL